jgi:predicted molibdopterin-dependent oxidoreductase YjgC
MNGTIALTIDGRQVTAPNGSTILEAARKAGVYVPTLCADSALAPYGACRLCLVEVKGNRRPMLPSCSTPAADGMVVRTSTPLIERTRRNIVELLLSDHPEDCLTCPQNNRCELQRVAAYVGVRQMRFRGEKRSYTIDDSNPFFVRDLDRCILCGKCVRVCDEIQGREAIHYAFRGFDTKIAAVMDRPLSDSNCESCGQCVDACPVGALQPRSYIEHGTPARRTKTICPYCGVGCTLIIETRGGQIVGVRGDPDGPANEGRTCVKGRFGTRFVNHRDRLTTPLIRKEGELVEATWDEALDLVASKFAQVKCDHGGDALGMFVSAKCSSEENYLGQKLARQVWGTNNVDHCARL